MAYNLTKIEQETIILFNEEENTAYISTFNNALIRKLSVLCEARPDEATGTGPSTIREYCFKVPKKWVKVNASLVLSEEALKQRRANAAAANKNKAKTTEHIVETGEE